MLFLKQTLILALLCHKSAGTYQIDSNKASNSKAPFTLYRIAIVAPQLSYRIGVLFTSHQSYTIHDVAQIGAKITSLRR